MKGNSGSATVWLVIIVLLILGITAAAFFSRVFLLTTGTDSSQIDTYNKAIDSAEKIKNQMENGGGTPYQLENLKERLNY